MPIGAWQKTQTTTSDLNDSTQPSLVAVCLNVSTTVMSRALPFA